VNGVRIGTFSTEEMLATKIEEQRRRAERVLESGVGLSHLYERLIADELRVDVPLHPPRRVSCELDGAPARGPSLAPVTLVVFAGLTCPSCPELATTVERLRATHPGRVRVVWKHFVPPYGGSGPEPYAAELAVEAQAQGRFWALHDLALLGRRPRVRPGRAELDELALAAGVDLSRLARDQKAGLLRPVVERDVLEAHRLGGYSPIVLVNGIVINVPWGFERLNRVVEEELDHGLLERLRR
jgi:protein-disulfide isomerase